MRRIVYTVVTANPVAKIVDIIWEAAFRAPAGNPLVIGKNDLRLMRNLVRSGSDHGKFMRMITATMDITAPLYWWKEFDTYKIGTVANSCSTMHKIHAKEFTLNDFSHEHLDGEAKDDLFGTISVLNHFRKLYSETKEKKYWWQMIQLLPSSYNQRRTVQLNYEVMRNMYNARKDHKLDEWRDFCKIIIRFPYFSELLQIERYND